MDRAARHEGAAGVPGGARMEGRVACFERQSHPLRGIESRQPGDRTRPSDSRSAASALNSGAELGKLVISKLPPRLIAWRLQTMSMTSLRITRGA
jgi:hypothetical protein